MGRSGASGTSALRALLFVDDRRAVAFERASGALAAALAALAAFDDAGGTGTPPRCAVHVGEVDVDGDGAPQGRAVEVGGDLIDAAHPGQLLVTAVTLEVVRDVRDDAATAVDLLPLGTHRLAHASAAVPVVQVTPRGHPATFPPLRGVVPAGASLPIPDSSFVGRGSDLSEVGELVAEHRLVTIVGAGGCGKTRLAVELGRHLADRFADGVIWVDLGPVTTGAAVADAAATAVGARGVGPPTAEQVADHLAARDVLVVVDNCEHVIVAAAALVSAVRAAGARVRVLATSREPLAVTDEAVWRVPSLSVPVAADGGDLLDSDSGRLLLDRLHRLRPDRQLDPADLSALAAICRRLDGIPLAIELAAARAASMSPVELADRLAERFTLLAAGTRDVMARQRTLEASVAWSYQLLDHDGQRAFRRLGAFTGPFAFEAAADLCADADGAGDALVDRLVDCSLLVEVAGPGRRLSMLETVRWFARERLLESGEASDVFGLHLDLCVEVARRHGRRLEGRDVTKSLAVLDREIDNLRAAMRWAVANGRGDDVARIVAATAWYWIWRGRLREAVALLDEAEPAAGSLGPTETLDLLWARAMLLNTSGSGAHEAVAAAGIDLARRLGDDGAEVRFHVSRARHQAFTEPHVVLAEVDGHRARCRRAGDGFWAATSTMAEALAQITLGRFDLAEGVLDRMAQEAARVGHPQLAADVVARRVLVDRRLGRLDAVESALVEIDEITAGFTDFNSRALVYAQVALVEVARGRAAEALEMTDGLFGQYLAAGEYAYLPSFALSGMAALIDLGRPQEALDRYEPVWQGCREAVSWRLRLGAERGAAHLAVGDLDAARAQLIDVVTVATDLPNEHEVAIAETHLAAIDRTEGAFASAEARLHRALEVQVRLGYPQFVADVLEGLAGLDLDHDRPESAAVTFAAVAAVRAEAGVVRRGCQQPTFEADGAALRGRMSDDTYRAAWERGSALGLDDIVDLVRRGRGARGRPATGWESLTATEDKVAALVADGLTNPEIADRLLMGRATVKTHVSSILRKLGLTNRTQVAGAAARRDRAVPDPVPGPTRRG